MAPARRGAERLRRRLGDLARSATRTSRGAGRARVEVDLSRTAFTGPGPPGRATIRVGTVKLDDEGVPDARPGARRARMRSCRNGKPHRRARPRALDAGDGRRSTMTDVHTRRRTRGCSPRSRRFTFVPDRVASHVAVESLREPGCRTSGPPDPRAAVSSRAVRIGVAKEIKSDEYRVALTPAGRARADQPRPRGDGRDGRRRRERVRRRGLRARRRADRRRSTRSGSRASSC